MSRKRWPYLAATVILGVGAFLALRPQSPRAVEVGEAVPSFTLPTLSEGRQSVTTLKDYRGHVLVLNFWATWCPPCVVETPSLEKFAEQMRPLGVEVVGVSVDQDLGVLRKFTSDYHLTYLIARDPQQALPHRYGTLQYPETYIIDRDGRLAEKIISNIDWQDPRIISFVRELAHPEKQ